MKASNHFIITIIFKRALSIILAITLLASSTPAAPLTIKTVATEWHMSLGLWLRTNGLSAKLRRVLQDDGPRPQEKQRGRDARVTELKIYPGDVTIRISETVSFSAVAYDGNEAPVGGVNFKWSARDEGRNRLARVSPHGDFEAYAPGIYKVTAEVAGKSAHVKVTVLDVKTKPNKGEKPLNVHPVSTRDLPRSVSLKKSKRDSQRRSAHATPNKINAAPVLLPIEDWGNDNYWSADDPGNRRGDPPGAPQDDGAGSSNFQFAAPVLNLPGRGINIKLNVTYNSRLWNKAGSVINYDIDRDWPAPGWSLGFGRVVGMGDAGGSMIIDADGTRHAFRGNITNYGSSQYFSSHTVDGTFIDYSSWRSNGALTTADVNFPNGMNIQYNCQGPGGVFPTQIRDANGNFIRLTYVNNTGPRIQTITDTLNRVITFHYDSNHLLTAITAPGLTSGTRTLVRLHYRQLNLAQYANFGFGGVTAVARDSNPWVIDAIYFPGTNAGYWFGDSAGTGYQFGSTDSYSSYGMLAKVVEVRGMSFSGPDPVPPSQGPTGQGTISVAGQLTKKELYNYPLFPGDPTGTPSSNLIDAPTYTSMTQSWTRDGNPNNIESATTNYLFQENATNPAQPTVPSRKSEVTQPNGTKSIQYSYNYTSLADTDPLKALDGIAYQDETRDSSGVVLQSSVGTWQPGAYDTARPTRMDATNERGQTKATIIAYGGSYNQVTNVSILDYSGTVLHSTSTQYPNSANYTSRHIFNLPSVVEVYGPNNTRLSRTEYEYDGQTLTARPNVVQHDQAYNPYADAEGFCFTHPDWSDPDCIGGCIPELAGCDGFCPDVYFCPYDSGTDYRGNVTQVKTYANVDNSSATGAIIETRRYDITGNVVTATTACCATQTSFNYTINTQFGYAESQTRGSATDPFAQVKTSATYDFNTGAVLTTTDANNRVSQTIHDPVTLRPTTVLMVGGGHTDYNYDDAALSVTETTYLSAHPTDTGMADQKIKLLNGIAQIRQEKAFTKNTQGQDAWDVVDTVFDNMGRISQQSRPYRLGEEQPKFTIAIYDALSRTKKVIAADYTQPDGSDGSALQSFYNEPSNKQPSAASGQAGETCRVVDAWGRERWTRKDARGRLVELVEPNPDGNGAVATSENGLNPALDLVTTYAYDALNNLISVNQGGQTRSFKYDSLGRMTAQKLAEADATLNDAGVYQPSGGTWSDVFTYDDRSNITSRTDARGVRTNYNYNGDPLNRLQSVTFDTSGDPNHGLQPTDPNYYRRVLDAATVTYQYRTKGAGTDLIDVTQLQTVTTAGVSTKSYAYEDGLGRVTKRTLTLNSRPSYPMITNHVFDTLDRVTHVYYPGKDLLNNSGRKHIEPSYDLSSRVSGLTVDGQSQASEFVYNAASQTTQLKVGVSGPNQVIENYNYDPQTGLLGSQTLARSSAPTNWLLNLSYDYTGANGKRTGQLAKILNNLNHNKDRSYTYDALGRLTQAKGGPTGTLWSQTYTYDRFGNRTSVSATGSSAKASSQSNSQLAFGGNQFLPTDQLSANNNLDLPAFLRTDVPRSISDSSLNLGSRPASANPSSVTAAPQGPPVFTDDPLVPGVTVIKAVHITELRTAVNQARARAGLPAASWAESVSAGVPVKASHIVELRTQLDAARAALGLSPASYTDPGLAAGNLIKAAHVQELRQFVTQALASLPITPDGHTSLAYAAASNRITTAGFEYDAAGNQTRVVKIGGAVRKYQYDAANRLVTIRDNNNTVITNYTYGHDNQRLVTEEGGGRTYYAAENGSVLAEYTEAGAGTTPTWSKIYIYLGARLLSTIVPGGAPNTESVQYQHPDRLGTRVVTGVDSGGTPTSFEQVTMPFGTAFNSESTGSTTRRFTSYDRSVLAGLDYAANRYYDAEQGRFTQVDPLGMKSTNLEHSQSLNLYAYCLNDPINHTDPAGLGFLSFFKKLFRFLIKVLIVVALIVAVVYLGFLAAGLIVKAIGAGSLLGGILYGAAAFGVILGAMFVGGMAFGMVYTTILDAIKRCRVPNFSGLSGRRQDELTRLGVTPEQWNNLPNKSRLAYFNITSAIAAAGLSLEGWKVDWAAGGIQRDRVFFIAGPGASNLVAQVRATGRFNHGTNPRSEHKDYTDSWRGGFHPSLQLSFTTDGTRLDADLDSFNPSRGLFGLLFHGAEVSAHWIGGKAFGSKFTNPLAVGSRSNWECS